MNRGITPQTNQTHPYFSSIKFDMDVGKSVIWKKGVILLNINIETNMKY